MESKLLHEEVLEIIGLDATKKDMVILGALLKAQKKPSDFIDFETLREQLAIEEGSRKGTDPLIYRSLSLLEKEGLVRIDSTGHKHGYNSSIAIMGKALDKIVSRQITNTQKELNRIDSDISILSEMNLEMLASGLIDITAGKKRIEKPIFAQGLPDIFNLLEVKVYKGLKKGDIIRITLEWLSQGDYIIGTRVPIAENLLKRGVDFRVLDHDRGEKKIRKNVRKEIIKMRRKFSEVGYRIFQRKDATYQFVSRNTEGIVLVVSESPLSATWLPREANPELIDNAIDSFDKDYEAGIDILDFEG